MGRREIGLVSSTLLLPAALFLAVTGLVSDALDLNEFVLHKYVGYTAAVLALVHVGAHWPSLVGFWTGRGGRRSRAATATTAAAGDRDSAADMAPAPGTEPASEAEGSSPRGIPRRAVLAAAGVGATGFAAGWLVRPADVGRLPGEDVGALYHRASTPGIADALGALVSWGSQPARTKEYPGAARFELPPVTVPPELSVASAIERRRSLRDYAGRPLTTGELSWLLGAASGITGPGGLRAAPSAGAQYPIETYVAVTKVDGLEPGIYHYAPADHALERVRGGTFGGDLVIAGLGQEFLGQAPVVVVLSAIFQRLRWRYRERAYRYALIEVGHIGQNVYLAAEAAGFGACAVGAFLDDAVNGLLEIDGVEEAALMLLPVGPR
ncbi:MAG: SagB/ThcOx family dehydrogenase [Chloroflexi bacterium]|nr:SagB/ThcOx family dehydrogenase [Chloroflexota bacterium]